MTFSRTSAIMRANRAKDTGPEIALRRALHARGLRFRLNVRNLPGSPDLVFPRHHCVIFVHGCYWHHHKGCKRATIPETNRSFWISKFEANRVRDERTISDLRFIGWRVGVVWECSLKSDIVDDVALFIRSGAKPTREWPAKKLITYSTVRDDRDEI
ncbi:very short patch repair endonuclease [Paracoccus sanguinis]|uniref:very short patch repair endonuclease n=1 Tax=Paracoccus sanguinis TaxID=1545044 RepID=UPI0009454DA6|nr:very short patch repair endonuclease [Paracoccus sanguinis]